MYVGAGGRGWGVELREHNGRPSHWPPDNWFHSVLYPLIVCQSHSGISKPVCFHFDYILQVITVASDKFQLYVLLHSPVTQSYLPLSPGNSPARPLELRTPVVGPSTSKQLSAKDEKHSRLRCTTQIKKEKSLSSLTQIEVKYVYGFSFLTVAQEPSGGLASSQEYNYLTAIFFFNI